MMGPYEAIYSKKSVKYFSALNLKISASLQKLRHFKSYQKWKCSRYTLKMEAGSSLLALYRVSDHRTTGTSSTL
jgi:hypothetical protein